MERGNVCQRKSSMVKEKINQQEEAVHCVNIVPQPSVERQKLGSEEFEASKKTK